MRILTDNDTYFVIEGSDGAAGNISFSLSNDAGDMSGIKIDKEEVSELIAQLVKLLCLSEEDRDY